MLEATTGVDPACVDRAPRKSAVRRLSHFEYNNTVRDLFGDTTQPAKALPSEEIGNGFGNDTAAQPVSSLLAEQYATVAEGVAERATSTPAALAKLNTCTNNVAKSAEPACARTIIERIATSAYRRPLASGGSKLPIDEPG